MWLGGRAYYQKYTTEEDVIGNNMFGGFKTIKQLILPDNIKAIGPHSLFGCEILLSIHIPEGVKKSMVKLFNCVNFCHL